MADELMMNLLEIQEHFRCDRSGSKLYEITNLIIKSVKVLGSLTEEVQSFACNYDVDETTPGNGFRSFVYVTEKAIEKTFVIARQIQENRGKLFFRRKFHEK
jgi:hypothetical protein